MRTQVLIDMYIKEARDRQLAPKTVDGYLWALDKLAKAFPDLLPCDPTSVLEFIAIQELSETSRHDLWRFLRTFWRWASDRGLSENTMDAVPAPQVRSSLPRTLSDHELSKLLCPTLSQRDMALVAVPLDNGIRLGEIASLRWSGIRDTSLLVSGKVGDRVVPISPNVRHLLTGLGDGNHVWMGRRGPLTRSGIQLTIRRIMKRAGIAPPKSGPHVLRHTFALQYILNGGDVFSLQKIMGHSNIQSTMIYVHMSTVILAERHAEFSPLSGFNFDVGHSASPIESGTTNTC